MYFLEAPYIAIRSFFEAGGDVLWAIFVVTMLMWALIVERIWFFRAILPRLFRSTLHEWESREDKISWNALQIRAQMISEVSIESHRNISIIQVLMVLLPLLGLLGTVTGMIQVFNVMAIAGTSNARLMAGGVSAATIPTMAGLVAALSGLYLTAHLKKRADKVVNSLENFLGES
jgi:biopolymer transport protein ExbB